MFRTKRIIFSVGCLASTCVGCTKEDDVLEFSGMSLAYGVESCARLRLVLGTMSSPGPGAPRPGFFPIKGERG